MSSIYDGAGVDKSLLPAAAAEYLHIPNGEKESPLRPTKCKPQSEWRINDPEYMNQVKARAKSNPLLEDDGRYI